jgi:hypothetical protein
LDGVVVYWIGKPMQRSPDENFEDIKLLGPPRLRNETFDPQGGLSTSRGNHP